MPHNQQATQAIPRTEDFTSEIQCIGQRSPESTSDNEDYEDNPPWPTQHNVSNTGVVASTNSNGPPLVILNDPDEGFGSQEVKPTEDMAWFFETDPADGTWTCWVCWYVIFCSIHYLFSDQGCNSTAWAAGKVAPVDEYKKSTGGGNLRAHIDKNHGALYLEQVSSRGWVNKLPSQTRSHTSATGHVSPGSPCPNNFIITKLHGALENFVMADN